MVGPTAISKSVLQPGSGWALVSEPSIPQGAASSHCSLTLVLVLLLLCPWLLMDPVAAIWFCIPVVRSRGVAPADEATANPEGHPWPSSLSSWSNPASAVPGSPANFPSTILSAYSQSIALCSDYKDILGAHSEGLTKVILYNILCSLLVYRTSHPILEDNEVGQERFVLVLILRVS